MKRRDAVILLAILVTAVTVIFCANYIGGMSSDYEASQRYQQERYLHNIRVLNDTIISLNRRIASYREEIERIDLEREKLRKELRQIFSHNEKIDTELSNGDWDYNVRFLTDYLSKEGDCGERHCSGDYEMPAIDD